MTDIEIARSVKLQPITQVAARLNLSEDDIECYGKYKAKIDVVPSPKTDRLILVTAINPTSLGEGKTTTSIGLADGMAKLGKSVCLALREPSLGPVFGIKGGATGGGRAQVAPMEDINLHFTGDLHAITCANNLIAAMLDNHIYQGNALRIDPVKTVWKRCLDMNDRALRNVVIGLGGPTGGVPRQDGFNITAASEIMAVLCLAADMDDLKRRIGDITVAYDYDGNAVTCAMLGIADAVAIGHARNHSRRTICQYRSRMQQHNRYAHGYVACRLRSHGSGLRRGSGRGEVHRYQVPRGGYQP